MHSILEPITAKVGERSNWDVLALLRFLLALIVALTHDLGTYCPQTGITDLGTFEAILGFLLISGYSIGSSIQKEPHGFLRRRMLRIYPVYLAAMLLTYFVQRDALTGPFIWIIFIDLLFLSQVIVRDSYVGPAWSLGLEVWLYCLAPLFIRLRARSPFHFVDRPRKHRGWGRERGRRRCDHRRLHR